MCCIDSGSLIHRPNEKLLQEIQGPGHTSLSFTAMLVQEQIWTTQQNRMIQIQTRKNRITHNATC